MTALICVFLNNLSVNCGSVHFCSAAQVAGVSSQWQEFLSGCEGEKVLL
jgi:hypothetical protein